MAYTRKPEFARNFILPIQKLKAAPSLKCYSRTLTEGASGLHPGMPLALQAFSVRNHIGRFLRT